MAGCAALHPPYRGLSDALVAVDGALEVYRAGNATYYVEKAERLRAMIVAEQE